MPESAYLNSEVSSPRDETVSLQVPALPAYVSVVRLTLSAMASRCGFDIEAIEDIKVSVAEAVTNAVIHTNEQTPSVIHITSQFSYEKQQLIITITDKGQGFDLQQVRTPDISNLEAGGLGLFIIRSLMDEVLLSSNIGQGTNIKMIKKLGGN